MAMATGKAQGLPLWQLDQGEVANVPPVSVPAMGASETQNIVFFDGRVRPRPGFQISVVSPPASEVTFDPNSKIVHIGSVTGQNSQYNLLRAQASPAGNLSVYQFASPGYPWAYITGGALAYDPASIVSSAQFGNAWLLCTGVNNLQSWDGAGSLRDVTAAQANIGLRAPANPKFLCATGSRVFLGNAIDPNSGQRVPYRVWWSQTLDFTIWGNGAGLPAAGSASYQDLIQGRDSSPITGMYFQGATQVIVFKRHSIYRGVYKGGPVWYDFLSVTQSRGCVAPGSIQCLNDVLIWLADDYNVYTLDLQGSIRAVGDPIRPRIQKYFDPAFNIGNSVTSFLDVVLGLYWLIIPYADERTGSTLHKIFTCNLHTGAWSEGEMDDPASAICSAFWLQPDPPFAVTAPVPIFGWNNGSIYAMDYAAPKMVDGPRARPFDAYWWSKTYDFLQFNKGAGEVSEFSKIMLHGSAGTAIPRIRMGQKLVDITKNSYLYTFEAVTQDLFGESYSANNRVDAQRFGQMGVHWAQGTADPFVMDGMTVWGIPRGGEAR